MPHLKACSEVTKFDSEVSFSKIWTVQPSQGLRPRLDSPDQGKENSLKTKKKLKALIIEGVNPLLLKHYDTPKRRPRFNGLNEAALKGLQDDNSFKFPGVPLKLAGSRPLFIYEQNKISKDIFFKSIQLSLTKI